MHHSIPRQRPTDSSRGVTVVAGPPDPYGLIGMVQTIYCCYYTAHSTTWEPDAEVYPFDNRPPGHPGHFACWRPAKTGLCLRFRRNTQCVLWLRLPSTGTAPLSRMALWWSSFLSWHSSLCGTVLPRQALSDLLQKKA